MQIHPKYLVKIFFSMKEIEDFNCYLDSYIKANCVKYNYFQFEKFLDNLDCGYTIIFAENHIPLSFIYAYMFCRVNKLNPGYFDSPEFRLGEHFGGSCKTLILQALSFFPEKFPFK